MKVTSDSVNGFVESRYHDFRPEAFETSQGA
jgi:hypothetical protein